MKSTHFKVLAMVLLFVVWFFLTWKGKLCICQNDLASGTLLISPKVLVEQIINCTVVKGSM